MSKAKREPSPVPEAWEEPDRTKRWVSQTDWGRGGERGMRAEAGGGRRGVDITHRQTVLHKSLVYVKMCTRVKTLSPQH